MSVVQTSSAIEVLAYLQVKLNKQFIALHEQRQALVPASPVFALEHDLEQADRELLVSSVRTAIANGLTARFRVSWLPFVVYAAESGYDYTGDEYWTSFESETPGWRDDQRHWIQQWFMQFAAEYGGVIPTGAFAKTFTIIAWPITHAVLPTYLQRQLAQLLFEFRAGLTTSLLSDLDELGVRLEVRARLYSDRFRIFCQNTALLGRVAAALLSGEDEESPYLVKSTLDRLVEGLSRERESRQWFESARQAASRIRTTGFASNLGRVKSSEKQTRQPASTDPTFFLRQFDGGWNAYAGLPDMTPLSDRLTHIYDELRTLRGVVNGGKNPIPRGGLVFPGQEVRLEAWPNPSLPFVQLEGGTSAVNSILADQSVMSKGPWWLYRLQGSGLAIEVKGRFLRPGHSYLLIGADNQQPPAITWSKSVSLRVNGANAYRLDVPEQISEDDAAALVLLGLSTLSTIALRPVGIVASSWDGEGAAEWLAGEPAIIGIRSDLIPTRCLLTVDGLAHFIQWPDEAPEMILSLDALEVGAHEVSATVLGADERELSGGVLAITVRDPQVRPESATNGEGIRMLASPARPTLAEVWDRRASVTVDGAPGALVELVVSLRGARANELATIRRKVELPIDSVSWTTLADGIRLDRSFRQSYDDAESCVVEVHRDSIGMASLTFERGFQPLRWQFVKPNRQDAWFAKLHDRTDGGDTRITYFLVEEPLKGVACDPDEATSLSPRGGLLRAAAGDSKMSAIAPTNPNAVVALGAPSPFVPEVEKSIAGVMKYVQAHNMWASAELPADVFATHEQLAVLEAIARSNSSLLNGSYWAELEGKMAGADEPADYLEDMRDSIGISAAHRSLASEISRNLFRWSEPALLISGFDDVIQKTLIESGIKDRPAAARFLLTFAGRPGKIAAWQAKERDFLLGQTINSPVLLRAARFAVLGTRALNDPESIGWGF